MIANGNICVCDDKMILYQGKCYKNTLLDSVVSDCPDGEYEYEGACHACADSCETCIGPGDNCLECKGATATCQDAATGVANFLRRRVEHTDYKVYQCYCPDGQYAYGGVCTLCPSECASCTSTSCTTCAPVFVEVYANGTTSCECPLGTVHDGAYCYPLVHSQCDIQRTYPKPDGTCAECHSSCAACDDSSNYACVKCRNGMTLEFYESNTRGECVCPEGAWIESE
jgi:proprotein convertase subtilisin/kexin type 5